MNFRNRPRTGLIRYRLHVRAIAHSFLKTIIWNNGCCNYFYKEVLLPDFRNLNSNCGGAKILIQN